MSEVSEKLRVLIADDMDILRSVLRAFLEDEGFSVTTAPNCATARRLALEGTADVLLSDVRMPDGSGIQLCEELLTARPELGVVLMTGFPNEKIPAWVSEKNVALLFKPLALVDLSHALRQAYGTAGRVH